MHNACGQQCWRETNAGEAWVYTHSPAARARGGWLRSHTLSLMSALATNKDPDFLKK